MIFLVDLEMVGKVLDPLSQNGDLNLRRSRILAMGTVFLNQRVLRISRNAQRGAPLAFPVLPLTRERL